MDTHITTAPDIDERIGAPLGSPIRLPGGRGTLPHLEDHDLHPSIQADAEPEAVGGATTQPREKLTPVTPARSRRKGLLATVAIAVVLAGIGGVAWAERQGALQLPLPPLVIALLKTGLPVSSQVAGEVGVKPARVPAAPLATARVNSEQSAQASRQVAEFAALKTGDAATEVGAAPSNRPATPPAQTTAAEAVPSPVPAPVSPPVIPSAQATVAALTPVVAVPSVPTSAIIPVPVTAPIPSPVSASAPNPLDPVQTAIELRPAPFSTKQQVDMVGLVRELGAQLKESRLTVAQMQTTVAELKDQLDTRMTEFDGRLGLAEAGTVLAQSAKAALPQPVMTAAAVPARAPVASRQSAPNAPVAAPVSPATRSVKDFRVQGASPGLAVLNVLVAGPGEAPVLYVALGDHIPGIGRIKSIYQRGTTWLVQTDAGLIQ